MDTNFTSQLVKKKEVATAFRVNCRTVDNWMRTGTIPFIRISCRLVRFHLPSVAEALMKHTTEAK